jgi:hypothetical protein
MKKKVTAEALSASAWAAALATPMASDVVPEGWRTTREVAAELGKSYSYTGKLLGDAVIDGRCQNESEKRIYDRLHRIAAELDPT